MDAENTHQVFAWLWSSGQLSERDIRSLPVLEIELVVNLALPTASNALPGEAELVTGQGMVYAHIPVIWEQPRPEQCGCERLCKTQETGRICETVHHDSLVPLAPQILVANGLRQATDQMLCHFVCNESR